MRKRILSSLSQEAIGIQVNDGAVKEMVEISSLIRSFINGEMELTAGLNYYVRSLEKIISNRFGFNVKINTGSSSLMGVRLVGFNTHAGLESFKVLTDAFSTSYLQPKHIMDFREGIRSLDQWAKVKSLKIDEFKGRITGLPDKFYVDIYCNIVAIFSETSKYNFTSKEFVAMLLHEIGHVFTYISYSWKTRAMRIAFEDSISHSLKKGTDAKRAFLIGYKESFDKDLNLDDYKSVPFPFAVISVLKKFKDRKVYDMGRVDNTQQEIVADQFVSRFGYGKELASSLKKIIEVKSSSSRSFSTTSELLYSMVVISIVGCVVAISLLSALFAAAIIGLIGLIVLGTIFLLSDVVTEKLFEGSSGSYSEDDAKRLDRLNSVYLDYVRQIRTEKDLDKDIKEDLIAQAETIKKIIEDLKSQGVQNLTAYRKSGLINKVINFLNIGNVKDYNNMEELDQLLESLSENNLHLAASKFQLLKQ